MQRKHLVDLFVYLVVRLLICLVQALRIETGQKLIAPLAWMFDAVLGIRRKVIAENLAHAFPELSGSQRKRLARRMWEHLFLLVLEVAHAPRKIHETNWRDYISLRDQQRLVRLLLDERPTLIITGHFGNFELAGYVLAILGFPTYTVARNLDNPYLDRFLNRFRGSTGQYIIPKKGGYDQIVAVLNRGGAMTFVADQYAGRKGCWVEFFGRPASAHKAIALLALANDAPVAVCSGPRLDRPLHIRLDTHAVADPRSASEWADGVRHLTQWYTSQLETAIRAAPTQYWWLHRRWKTPQAA